MVRSRFWGALGALLLAAGAAPVAHAQGGLAAQTLYSFIGPIPYNHLGTLIAGAGDADGDHRGDFLIGSNDRFEVVSGATGQTLYTVKSPYLGDFEQAVAFPIRDVDRDGLDDIVVGAPYSAQGGGAQAGTVSLYSGATGKPIFPPVHVDVPGAHYGAAVALLGDTDGDGIPEVIVGAPTLSPGGKREQGNVAIVSLRRGLLAWIGTGEAGAGGHLGSAVAPVGDVSGDGAPDFAVSAPLATVRGVQRAGIVFIISGKDGAILDRIPGDEPEEQFGASLANAGDVEGNGRQDLIIGAPGRHGGTGAVFVVSNLPFRHLIYPPFEGPAPGAAFGTAVAGGGDYDGDGRPDILIGAPGTAAGSASDAGEVQVYSGKDGHLLMSQSGNAGDRMGAAVAYIGDINGDERTDIAVGAPRFHVFDFLEVGFYIAAFSIGGV